MDFIHPVGPVERDVDPVRRVERAAEEREQRRERREQRDPGQRTADRGSCEEGSDPVAGPVQGDDGQMHVDVRA